MITWSGNSVVKSHNRTLTPTREGSFRGKRAVTMTRLKRVIVTPAVYPRLVEFLHFDIQSTGQKSHCVNTVSGHRNALF